MQAGASDLDEWKSLPTTPLVFLRNVITRLPCFSSLPIAAKRLESSFSSTFSIDRDVTEIAPLLINDEHRSLSLPVDRDSPCSIFAVNVSSYNLVADNSALGRKHLQTPTFLDVSCT
jgi:hypothetical protein